MINPRQTRLYTNVAGHHKNPPTAPGQTVGLVCVAGDTQVTCSWAPTSGATSYTLQKATVIGTWSNVATGITATNKIATGLTNGTPYFFRVKAVNSVGSGAYSIVATATPSGSVPGKVAGLVVTAGNQQNGLAWTATATATSYKVYRGTITTGPYTVIASPATNSYTDTGLANGTPYFYVVSAVNANGEGAQSDEGTGTPVSVIEFGLNLRSAVASHETMNELGLTFLNSNGYTHCRVPIAMDAHGNTARPYLASTDLTTFVNKAIDDGLTGVTFLMNNNPKLDGTYVLGLNSNVPWTTQTRPPVTVDPYTVQCFQDAIDTIEAACILKLVTFATFASFECFNEQGKGGNQGPTNVSGGYDAPYDSYQFGYIEPAWITRMSGIIAGVNFKGAPVILLTTESAEVDTDSKGQNDCEVEIASLTGADWTTMCAVTGAKIGMNCYAKKPASPYVKATAQANFQAKVARQVARLATVCSLTPIINEFGCNASNGPGGGIDVQTYRDDLLECLKTQTGVLRCCFYTAFTDTSFNILDDLGAPLRGITVAP